MYGERVSDRARHGHEGTAYCRILRVMSLLDHAHEAIDEVPRRAAQGEVVLGQQRDRLFGISSHRVSGCNIRAFSASINGHGLIVSMSVVLTMAPTTWADRA